MEDDLEIRGTCVMGLLTSRHPRRTEFLVEALADKDAGIRGQAWEALALLGPPVRFEPNGAAAGRSRAIAELRAWAQAKGKAAAPGTGTAGAAAPSGGSSPPGGPDSGSKARS